MRRIGLLRHYWSLETVHLQDTWLTIGSFDGVHRGHQEIVKKLSSGAHTQAALAVVLTFYPHPAVVLGRRKDPFYLTTSEERAAILSSAGADVIITHPFDQQIAATAARDFVARLKDHLQMTHLLVGQDFALGKDREGNIVRLGELGEEFGFSLEVMPPVKIDGVVVSSSKIRSALAEGQVEEAAKFLGRPYRVTGKVVSGDGRGKRIGIPTANLEIWPAQAIPQAGVYTCRAAVNGRTWGAVTNIGVRPTFESLPVPTRVETHLLDFHDEIYGDQIQLDFISKLRSERRFPSAQALVEQIRQDIAAARQTLAQFDKET